MTPQINFSFMRSPETKDTERHNRTAFLIPALWSDSFIYSAVIREFLLGTQQTNN